MAFTESQNGQSTLENASGSSDTCDQWDTAPLSTMVLTLRIKPGEQGSVLRVFEEFSVLENSMSVPGAIDTWLSHPKDAPEDLAVFTRWARAEDYDGWLNHPQRALIIAALTPLLAGPPTLDVYEPAHEAGTKYYKSAVANLDSGVPCSNSQGTDQ